MTAKELADFVATIPKIMSVNVIVTELGSDRNAAKRIDDVKKKLPKHVTKWETADPWHLHLHIQAKID